MTEPRDPSISPLDIDAAVETAPPPASVPPAAKKKSIIPPVAPLEGWLGSPDRAPATRPADRSAEDHSAPRWPTTADATPVDASTSVAEPSSSGRSATSDASGKPFLDVAFLTSWRGAFLVAGLISCIVTGSKLVFGPELGARIVSIVSHSPYAGVVPPDEIMNLPLAVPPAVSVEYSLAELVDLMSERMNLAFEPVDEHAFVLRATGDDVLLKQPFEIALRFRPFGSGSQIFVPSTGGVISSSLRLEALALNRQEGTADDIVRFLFDLRTQILARRTSAAADAARAAE